MKTGEGKPTVAMVNKIKGLILDGRFDRGGFPIENGSSKSLPVDVVSAISSANEELNLHFYQNANHGEKFTLKDPIDAGTWCD